MRKVSLYLYLVFAVFPQPSEGAPAVVRPWPPVVDQTFPDLPLIDAESGKEFQLSSLKGKPLLIEFIGMNCPACNGFSGAKAMGPFQNGFGDGGLDGIETYLKQNNIDPKDNRFTIVCLILYGANMEAPLLDSAKKWRSHFKLDRFPNWKVVVFPFDFRNQASYDLVPGFQLVDKNFILIKNSAGHSPKHSLWNDTLPKLSTLINSKSEK